MRQCRDDLRVIRARLREAALPRVTMPVPGRLKDRGQVRERHPNLRQRRSHCGQKLAARECASLADLSRLDKRACRTTVERPHRLPVLSCGRKFVGVSERVVGQPLGRSDNGRSSRVSDSKVPLDSCLAQPLDDAKRYVGKQRGQCEYDSANDPVDDSRCRVALEPAKERIEPETNALDELGNVGLDLRGIHLPRSQDLIEQLRVSRHGAALLPHSRLH